MKKKSFIYIILAGILWGTSGIFVHYLAPYGFTSLQMTTVRGLVSFIFMAIYILIYDKRLFKVKAKNILFFIGIGISLFGTASCYFASMQATSISTAVVLMYTAPVYVMIFSVLFLGEKFSKLKLLSVVSMLIGCCLVSGIIGGLKFNTVGILIGVLAGISYGAYSILTKISIQKNNSPLTTTMYSFLCMTIISMFVTSPQEIIANTSHNPIVTIPLLLGLGIFAFVLPYSLYTTALKEIPAGTASALSIVEPMAATIFSVALFGEALNIFSISGILLILAAVFLLSKAENPQK